MSGWMLNNFSKLYDRVEVITITLTGSDNEFYQGASWIESEFGLSDEFFAPLEQRVADLGAGDQQRVAPKVQKTITKFKFDSMNDAPW